MKTLTPIRAIRAKCMDCCCYSAKEVRLCPSEDCPLHPYRMGHRPTADADGTDEDDEEAAQLLESEADNEPGGGETNDGTECKRCLRRPD